MKCGTVTGREIISFTPITGEYDLGDLICEMEAVIETVDHDMVCIDCALGLLDEDLIPPDMAIVLKVLTS